MMARQSAKVEHVSPPKVMPFMYGANTVASLFPAACADIAISMIAS